MLAPLFLLWDRTNGCLIRLCGRLVGDEQAWRDAISFYRRRPGMLGLAYLCSMVTYFLTCSYSLFDMCNWLNSGCFGSLTIAPLVSFANMLPRVG